MMTKHLYCVYTLDVHQRRFRSVHFVAKSTKIYILKFLLSRATLVHGLFTFNINEGTFRRIYLSLCFWGNYEKYFNMSYADILRSMASVKKLECLR